MKDKNMEKIEEVSTHKSITQYLLDLIKKSNKEIEVLKGDIAILKGDVLTLQIILSNMQEKLK